MYLDLRDLAKELEDLKERAEAAAETDPDLKDPGAEPLTEDEQERMTAIGKIADDLGCDDLANYAENEPTAIPDHEFEAYAEELADDIGAIDKRASWPLNCIDWTKAAEELQADYSSFDFEGVTYWVRSC